MTRFALILCAFTAGVATPSLADVVPQPRPDDLVARTQAAAERVAAERAAAEADAAAVTELAQAVTEPADAAQPDAGLPDRAEIGAQIARELRNCWNVGNLSEEAMQVRIWVAFDTTPEGEVIRETIELARFENGTQDAADEALGPVFRAIMRCGEAALDLPPETHGIWQRVEMGFAASEVAVR